MNSTAAATVVVYLVGTWASLLSGRRGLNDCVNATDPTCTGGVAAVSAYIRNRADSSVPSLVISRLDKSSPFAQMHPAGWSVNRHVLHELLGWNVFVTTPSLLYQNKVDFETSQYDLTEMQTTEWPLLLTNVAVPPSNSWFSYTEAVHFDSATNLAILSIADSADDFNVDQIASAKGMLNYIARLNQGCGDDEQQRCWIPVIYHTDTVNTFSPFVEAIVEHESPPALILDMEGQDKATYSEPVRVGRHGVWVLSYPMNSNTYFEHRLTLSSDKKSIASVELYTQPLAELPTEYKDDVYAAQIDELRILADEAVVNNPVVGTSTFMPVARAGSYRRCKAGECEIGNLFADALRWRTDADVAFISSGGVRGSGWEAGPVRYADLFASLPFPNSLCRGTMSGVSLFKLLNYTTSVATFEGEETKAGGRLLQVSGLRVTYNTELQESRLIDVEVWDQANQAFLPVDRLRLYTFATDSYLCGAYTPYPELLGGGFEIEGEIPGKITDELHQGIVAEFLTSLDHPYNASIQGRLVNNTRATEFLNLVQSVDSCLPGTFYVEAQQTCQTCPSYAGVGFSRELVEFAGESGSNVTSTGGIVLFNGEPFTVSVGPKSTPQWLTITNAVVTGEANSTVTDQNVFANALTTRLNSGEKLTVDYIVNPSTLESGTARATLSFGVTDGGDYPGCDGQDATFDVLMRVSPTPDLNQLGQIRLVGWILSGIVILSSAFFAGWVLSHRKLRVVKTMQPTFLIFICAGVAVMGSALIPLSIDDGIVSDPPCMATPWLLSIGFSASFSALFSKLYRINKLFQNQFRKRKIEAKDVMGPFIVIGVLNIGIMSAWTLVDPLTWTRNPINGQAWDTYGVCNTSGTAGKVFVALTMIVNASALFLTCWQAYKARNISDEFSESKNLGIALFSWFQLFAIGVPVIMLITDDNPSAKFFLEAGLIFAVCMSMLLLIFWNILWNANSTSPISSGSRHASSTASGGLPTTSFQASGINAQSTFFAGGGNVHISGLLPAGRSLNVSSQDSVISASDRSAVSATSFPGGVNNNNNDNFQTTASNPLPARATMALTMSSCDSASDLSAISGDEGATDDDDQENLEDVESAWELQAIPESISGELRAQRGSASLRGSSSHRLSQELSEEEVLDTMGTKSKQNIGATTTTMSPLKTQEEKRRLEIQEVRKKLHEKIDQLLLEEGDEDDEDDEETGSTRLEL